MLDTVGVHVFQEPGTVNEGARSTWASMPASQIATMAAWRDRDEEATTTTCRHEAVRLARRIRTLDGDLAGNRADITELTRQDTPQLLELTGVGAVVAASVLIAWSHPGRVRS
ncbi:MAG: hypothetical protein M3R66_16465, partial [Actinomycetota bacterium]|nr:hypothetical protein [Actinomycetota bacterium]